ncbi:M48 family metallopeptidase [Candidatus Nomurabacteria bacterium]|nr:M48 family metallopeptidase [Candidatus Nomurabacteria bacterium]
MLRQRNHKHYTRHKEAARALVHARLTHYNTHYQLPLKKVFIKNTKSRWGSCSSRGNLNFSYKLLFLPPAVADYVIVHELCHLVEFNHGHAFWARVAEACPNYKELRQSLRTIERASFARKSVFGMVGFGTVLK